MKIQNYLQWFRACEVGDMPAIVEALPTYAKRKNTRGDTALILACKRGDRRMTKLLAPIEHGLCNDRGENAILTAIRYNQPGCVSDMCMYEIATRLKDGSTPLHFAAAMESIQSIVLMHGALKRARNSAGMTPFELACSLGKTEAVKKFIELGSHISKVDAARAADIAKENGFQNIADYIVSFEFPDIDPSIITASMRLLQSSKVSSKALALVADMSVKDKVNAVMNHSKVMTESFRNEVVPPMKGLSESMRLAQQKVCQVVNRYEVDKKKKVMEDFVNNIDELAFEREKPTQMSEEEIFAAQAAERRIKEQEEADAIQQKLMDSAAERSRKAAERLALAEQAAAEREIELLKESATRMQALSAFIPANEDQESTESQHSPLPVTLAQLTTYSPSVEDTFRASALEESYHDDYATTQVEVDVDDIINQVSASGVVNEAYELYSSDEEMSTTRGGSSFTTNHRTDYTVPEGVERYGSGEVLDYNRRRPLDSEEVTRDLDALRQKRQAIQERNRELHKTEDVIDTGNPFPLIGDPKSWQEEKSPFPSVSNHDNLDSALIVPRQYVPKTDSKGRPLHDQVDRAKDSYRSILITTQGNTPPNPHATMGPAQIQGLIPADYYGIRLYCTCSECTVKLTEIASQLHAKDRRIAALQVALEETRAFAAECVRQMQACTNCYQLKSLKAAGYTDELILANTATNSAHLVTGISPAATTLKGKDARSSMAKSATANAFSDIAQPATLKIEEYGFLPQDCNRPMFPRTHEDVVGFHNFSPRIYTSNRNSSPSKRSSTQSPKRSMTINKDTSTLKTFLDSNERTTKIVKTIAETQGLCTGTIKDLTGTSICSDRLLGLETSLRGTMQVSDYVTPSLHNETELMQAARCGNITEVQRLLDIQHGGVNSYGRTALMYAAEYGHLECVKTLAKYEDCVADRDGMTALMYAACFGHLSCVKVLLEREAGFKRPQDGATALMAACANGFDEIVSALLPLEKRAQTIDGRTALMIACQRSHLSCVLKMLPDEHDMATSLGRDALSYARENGNALIIHEVEKVFRQAQHLI